MFQLSSVFYASVLSIARCSFAQQSPLPVTYDAVLKSPINPNITISYKEPESSTCTTAFPSQKQYTGYVSLPPSTLEPYQQDYPINTFFWFFEARNNPDTAPLTIWLNGGPGSSSMIGLFREMGPCEIIQLENGSYGTQMNEWGWDRSSNLLFIDQPTQVGFSYDQPYNVSVNLLSGAIITPPTSLPEDTPAWGFLNGTLASGKLHHTENSTFIAARVAWHFLQGFLSAFPQYNPGQHPNRTTHDATGVNLFAESYGGQYGPIFADFFEDQNDRRRTGAIPANNTLEIKLASLGIINGIVDELIQVPTTASFVHNNSYGVQGLTLQQYLKLLYWFKQPSGCQDLASQCHRRATAQNYEGENQDEETQRICSKARAACWSVERPALEMMQRSPYDIRATKINSVPNYAYLEYLNSENVLKSIGAKVNFTETTMVVNDAFRYTGDEARGTQLQKLVDLIARGVRVAFVYGDADIICNWIGGEAVSLAVARESKSYSPFFPSAGYADIVSNASYIGGHVRQYGNLSFSRIFDAGHTIPSYQPETSFVVFSRIIQGDDIGSGRNIDLSTFSTHGPNNSFFKNEITETPKNTCWIRSIGNTCTEEEKEQIYRGLGVVEHGQWFPHADQFHVDRPNEAMRLRSYGKSSSMALTGSSTAVPTHTAISGASRLSSPFYALHRRQTPLPAAGESIKALAKQATAVQHGLTGGIAGVGGLLLSLMTLAIGVLGWRHHRYQKHDRNFLGGPRRKSSPLPISEPRSTSQPKSKHTFVERFVRQKPKSREEPDPIPLTEKPEELPAFDFSSTRRLSTPMEPIPEVFSPRPSGDIPERQLSQHPNEPVIVQHNARTPSSSPSVTPVEEPLRSREPSSELLLSRKPTAPLEESAAPEDSGMETLKIPISEPKPKTSGPKTEPATPIVRAASFPSEDKGSEAPPQTEPASVSALSEPDNSPKDKPSLLKRIRSSVHHDNNAFKAKAHTLF